MRLCVFGSVRLTVWELCGVGDVGAVRCGRSMEGRGESQNSPADFGGKKLPSVYWQKGRSWERNAGLYMLQKNQLVNAFYVGEELFIGQ